jgi:arylsulfatase
MYKHFNHEGGILSALIAHWPQGLLQANRWERTPIHVMDVMPTLCEIAQATYPNRQAGIAMTPLSGQSFLPVLRGEMLPERDLAFEHEGARALRHGDWKIVWGKRSPAPIAWELYHLSKDPTELMDLASQYPDKVKEMANRWYSWATLVGARYDKDHE